MEARALVAWNIRRLRVAKGISQDDLAYASGVERAYVGHLERGTKNPTIQLLEKLAVALGCELADLLRVPPKGESEPRALTPGRRKS